MEAAYDLIVLGGGPAGYTASERAAKAGLSTLCIERRALGGVCLNEGCVPTKTLLYSAKLFDGIRSGGRYGVTAEGAAIDHAAVLKRKDKVVKTLVAGVRAAMRESGAEVLFADAVIGGKTDSGYAVEAGGQRYIGKRLLIATGSESVVPPISGLNEALAGGFVMTSREILTPETPPERLVVIGGGVIGLELACYFCSIGTAVTVVELLDHIAGGNDPDLTVILQKNLAKKGMRFELNAKVTSIADGSITFERDGVTETIEADRALLCIGRRPVTADLGLSGIGVETGRGRDGCAHAHVRRRGLCRGRRQRPLHAGAHGHPRGGGSRARYAGRARPNALPCHSRGGIYQPRAGERGRNGVHSAPKGDRRNGRQPVHALFGAVPG